MLRKILLGLVVLVTGFLIFVSTRPDTYRVERTTRIEAPAPVVFGQLDDFQSWAAWSPWDKLDPQMKKTFEGPPEGVGAGYSWTGNDKVGRGKMTITDSTPPTRIAYRLEFIEPYAAVANTTLLLAPAGDHAASVTWSMEGDNTFVGKLMGMFMNMDQMIGADFEKGLASLKVVAENAAKTSAQPAADAAPATSGP